MKAPSDIAPTARLPPHGLLSHGSLMVFSSTLRTSMSTMPGPRPEEPLSCLNRRMGRQRDDIELKIWKDIDGCSWHEPSPHAIHRRPVPCRIRDPPTHLVSMWQAPNDCGMH